MVDILVAFVASLGEVFSWSTFSLLLTGLFIGFFVGLLPGMGGPVALALMLPFTFTMEPAGAFAFLLGMLTVTGTTGDITSILFGIPGEPHTAATVVDGHPMAKNGEAGRAIGAALMSSLIGAWVGAFALALAIPIFRPLVLAIGYGEYFMLPLVGLTLVASLTGSSFLKGLISAGTGLLLSLVGMDAITGIQRYTFGHVFLWDGLGLVVVTLGMFAIPELLDLAVKRTSIARTGADVRGVGGVVDGIIDTFRHLMLTLRCSVLGMVLALIPGMGASVCQWIAYGHAVQSCPEKRAQFGKGAVEGVIGPGAANNSTLGGHLIPTIVFGIPGGVVMAILLGAFIIQGIVPGPSMLTPERDGGHLTLVFSFVWTIVLANVIAVGAALIFLKPIIKITHVRATLLIPFILLLVYVGAFAEKNSLPALAILLLVGGLAWTMARLDWPRPPLILGIVLGPLLENNLFLATGAQGAAWLLRPGVLLLLVVAVVALLYPAIRKKRQLAAADGQPDHEATSVVNPKSDTIFDLFFVVLFAYALWASWDWPWRTRLFPWVVGWPMLGLSLFQLTLHARRWKNRFVDQLSAPVEHRRALGMWAWIAGLYLAIWVLGFFITVPFAILFYLRIEGGERWSTAIIVALVGWWSFGWLFGCMVYVPFPNGVLVEALSEALSPRLGGFVSNPLLCGA